MDDAELWQEAQERVLQYLKRLGLPALPSLDIASQALRQAVDDASGPGSERPVVRAMRALHMMFHRDGDQLAGTPHGRYRILYRRWQSAATGPWSCNPAAMPPINRGTMYIRKI